MGVANWQHVVQVCGVQGGLGLGASTSTSTSSSIYKNIQRTRTKKEKLVLLSKVFLSLFHFTNGSKLEGWLPLTR